MPYVLQTLTEYSDDAIVAELRRVASELGGRRLTMSAFNSRARVHSSTVHARFGSWRLALDRAGIDKSIAPRPARLTREAVLDAIKRYVVEHPNMVPTQRIIAAQLGIDAGSITRKIGKWQQLLSEVGQDPVPLGRRYTDDECFENVLGLWTHYGRQPHFAELKQPPSRVGAKAYVLRWGGWRRALAAFVARANDPEADARHDSEPARESAAVADPPTVVPRSISLSLRFKILQRDRFRCVACGRSPAKEGNVELHVDHIVPWSRGGQNVEANLRTLCFDCNLGKGSQLPEG